MSDSPLLIAIMGTTASGKTDFAEALADSIGAQLINNDAFQIYRGMDIGTAKSERKAEYLLMDIRNPNEPFGVGEWVRLASEELRTLNGKPAVVVGGTGLFVRALFEGYSEMADPPPADLRSELNEWSLEALQTRLQELDLPAYQRVDLKNRVRVQRAVERATVALTQATPSFLPPQPPASKNYRTYKFAVEREPSELEARIASRAEQMVRDGWVEEVARLRESGYSPDDPGLRAHGYRHIWNVLEGKMEMSQALELTTMEVRRYAKRQRTWLRKEPGLIPINRGDALEMVLRQVGLE